MVSTDERQTTPPVSAGGLRAVPLAAVAAVAGSAGGVLTSFGQTVLPGGWHALVNSASTWVMVALLVGMCAPGRWRAAAAAGLLSQVFLVAGYYLTSELRGYAAGMSAVVIWSVAGAVAGPAYGAAGALLRHHRRLVRVVATGITGSVWVVEGVQFLRMATDAHSNSGPGTVAGWAYIIIGVTLPLLLGRTAADRCYALLSLAAGAAAVTVATILIETAFITV